ncbi:hypothetical protein [Streptomyces sp. NBC_01233]|uniref:hypothetical protein n=1 Tax=Streptomyces sp. NBC_01233 TaxID=2903787 RepID=UPI002E120714|nr:hypothetical protein OG332_47580 [Streptomyces sp. NBC_01233]WSP96117.1 hypothetical protein OG332_47680 [Streptomyces sp. NBC_01233]
MPKYESPRNPAGARVCQFCHEHTVRESLGTKPVIYCSAACKQAAYAARKLRKAVEAAVEAERKAAAKSVTLGAERRPDGPAKSETFPSKVTDFVGEESQVSAPTSLTLPLDPAPPAPAIPAPARSEAAQEAFTAAAAAKSPRRRGATPASPPQPAEPSPHGRAGGDHAGWMAAFNRLTPSQPEQQPGLFEVQAEVEADDESL